MQALRFRCALAALVTVLGLMALAASAGADPVTTFFSDSYIQPTGSASDQIQGQDAKECPKAKHGSLPKVSFGRALADARQGLAHAAGSRALARMAQSPDVRKPLLARELAAAGMAANRPAAALAALLDAQKRAPHDPTTLVDLASVLSQLGRPADALGILAAIHGYSHTVSPLGIPLKAVALNDRGWALFALGRFSSAAPLFAAAANQAPLLAEARTNKAATKLCMLGVAHVAAPPPFRDAVIQPITISPPDGGAILPASSAYNLSQATPEQEPRIPTFPDARSTAAYHDDYAAFANDQIANDIQSIDSQLGVDHRAWLATHPSPATRSRVAGLWLALGEAGEPDLKRLDKQVDDAEQVLENDETTFQQQTPPTCDDGTNACCWDWAQGYHDTWLRDFKFYVQAEDQYFDTLSRAYTSIAANLSNASIFDEAMLGLREAGEQRVANLLLRPIQWSAYLTICGDPNEAPPADENPELTTPGAASCPPPLKGGVGLSLGEIAETAGKRELKYPVSLTVKCESVAVDVNSGGPIALFGQLTLDNSKGKNGKRNGSATIFVGGQVGVDLGPLRPAAKSGLYMKVGRDGVEDVGWRFDPGASANPPDGITSFGADTTAMDFSFVNVFDASSPQA